MAKETATSRISGGSRRDRFKNLCHDQPRSQKISAIPADTRACPQLGQMAAASWIAASKKMEPQITRNTQIQANASQNQKMRLILRQGWPKRVHLRVSRDLRFHFLSYCDPPATLEPPN